MNVELQIPDDVALVLCPDGTEAATEMPYAVLQALALEGYRSRRLSESQIRRLLHLETRLQVHAFLKQHGVPLDYSLGDLEQDILSLDRVEATL